MAKWEYKVETRAMNLEGTHTVETLLNQHGSEGWELVNIIPSYESSSNTEFQMEEIRVSSYSFIFKQQK